MSVLRRNCEPSARSWLRGVALATAYASMIACGPTGPESGAAGLNGYRPLPGGDGGESPETADDAAAPPSSSQGSSDASATGAVESGLGSVVDAGVGEAAATGGNSGGTGAGTNGGNASSDASLGGSADDSPTGPDFTLIDAKITGIINGSPVPGFDPIAENATIDLASVGSDISIRANTVPEVVGSVFFILDGTYMHTESNAPYFLCGDDGKGDISSCASILTVGQHYLIATPFTGTDLEGDAGTPFYLPFTIVDE